MTQEQHFGRLTRWGCGAALLLLFAVIAFAPGDAHAALPPGSVIMMNNTFQPQSLSVQLGTTVTWTNKDPSETHDVVQAEGIFASPPDLTYNLTYQWTPTQTGVYDYYCTYHINGMVGTITVLAAPTPLPAPARHRNGATIAATKVSVPSTHVAAPTSISVPVSTPLTQPNRH